MQKSQCGRCWLFDYFLRFIKNFLCNFFKKQASKDHLTQGNHLKSTLVNEKQSDLKKEMYGNISSHSQYFSAGAGSNVQKTVQTPLEINKSSHSLSQIQTPSQI